MHTQLDNINDLYMYNINDLYMYSINDLYMYNINNLYMYNINDLYMCNINDLYMYNITGIYTTSVLYGVIVSPSLLWCYLFGYQHPLSDRSLSHAACWVTGTRCLFVGYLAAR